jgi:gamma-glutamylcyclotransferase (GGCT)/AIG2-like uncharacterized protein YtfP
MTSTSKHLFVYGTLRHGTTNEVSQLLHSSADRVARGRARGQLYLVGDYPGFVPSETESDWVYGDVYRLNSPELTYSELDRYEGCSPDDPQPHEYSRSLMPVLLDSGAWIEASVYLYTRDTEGKSRIISGDYLSNQSGGQK